MTEEKLRKALDLRNSIDRIEDDIRAINIILDDYDNFGSDITFKKNSTGYSRSFGTKKYDGKGFLKSFLLFVLEESYKKLVLSKKEMELL